MSANENVSDRTPDLPASLRDLATQVLGEARSSDSGNAALTLTPSTSGTVKQTVVAVKAGSSVGPEHWNGPATVQVLSGRATVGGDTLGEGEWTLVDGEAAEISAEEDLAVLLTVAPNA